MFMLGVNRLPLQHTYNYLVAKSASAIAFVVGILILIVWFLDIKIFQNIFLGIIGKIQPTTAFCFALSGISLWLMVGKKRLCHNYLSRICAIAVGVISLLTLNQDLLGGTWGVDELLKRIKPYQGDMGGIH